MVPILTKEQRQENLAKGMRVRHRRAEYREQLKKGALPLEKFFELADEGDQTAAGMRVKQMITALPGYAENRADALMKKLRIRGSVIVMGRPRSSWEAKVCSTEPCDSSTLPKRTETKR